jgi:carboxyl-terminal processing protease
MPEVRVGTVEPVRVSKDLPEDTSQSFLEVLRYIRSEFVDRVENDSKLGYGAVRTMLVSLDDPKTRFYDPAQKKLLLERINGDFHGIGATLAVIKQTRNGIDQRRVAIVAPVPGGPADRAGLLPGDVISEIDGRWIIAYDTRQDLNNLRATIKDEKELRKAYESAAARMVAGMSLPKSLEALTANSGRMMALTVERKGHEGAMRFTLQTAQIQLEPVEYRDLSSSVGYLRITQFNDLASDKLTAALDAAKGHSLIVDLRNNAGGYVSSLDTGSMGAALKVLGRMIPSGPAASILRQGGRQEGVHVPGGTPTAPRMAVLVNGGTANLGELVAAALRDRGGAKLIGEKTFGDASWVKLFDLRDGAAMTVTSGKILTVHGDDFSAKGLQPDVVVAAGTPSHSDAALKRAIEVLEAGA